MHPRHPPALKRALALALTFAAASASAAPLRLDLDSSVELARRHSRSLLDRKDEVAAAEHRVLSSRARFFPQLKVAARYSRLNFVPAAEIPVPYQTPGGQPLKPITFGEGIEESYGLRFYLDQPVFSGFSLLAGMDAAHGAEAVARARMEMEDADLRVTVEEAYLGLWQAKELAQVARDSVRVLEAHEKSTANFRAQGQITGWEQDKIRARLAGAKAQVLQAENAVHLARLALLNLLGLPDDQELELADVLQKLPEPEGTPVDELVSRALGQRPELEVARASAEVRRAQARAAYAPMWPQVRIAASYGWDRPNQRYFPPENVTHDSWDAGVLLQWTFLDFGSTWHAAEALSLEADVAERVLRDLEEKVRVDVERRSAEARTVSMKIEATTLAVRAAEGQLTRAQSLCATGQSSCGTGVLDAELELTRARAEKTKALADARLAHVRLRRATGGSQP